jgi:hypothetical protein
VPIKKAGAKKLPRRPTCRALGPLRQTGPSAFPSPPFRATTVDAESYHLPSCSAALGELVQYSGTAEPASLKLTAETPQRLAGKWDYDDSAAGGPRVQIEFDAPLVKEITKPQ